MKSVGLLKSVPTRCSSKRRSLEASKILSNVRHVQQDSSISLSFRRFESLKMTLGSTQHLARPVPAAEALPFHKIAVTSLNDNEGIPSLVSASWLKDNLKSVRVLDGTWFMPNVDRDPVKEFQASRIPGSALFLSDVIADTSSGLPHMLPAPEVFASAVGAMGISNDTHVVVYDRHGVFSAPRVWWTFRVMGHNRVSVLDGGLPAWVEAGGEVETAPVDPARAGEAGLEPPLSSEVTPPYSANKDSGRVRTLDQIKSNIESAEEQVVDARSSGRFYGTAPEPRPGMRSGHIPGSKSVPFDSVLREGMAGMAPPEQIRKAFQDSGVDLDGGKPIVASCGSGMTACILALALDQIGCPLTSVYDGSWMEWGTREDVPVVTDD
uniref:Thiosulfate/3-mercaptopyruvate sulfurtransferase n=1 Tax=Tetraselmis sp. GSL018 TaxID=582737 RepID=A0A061QQ90_9CHLO